MQNPHLTMTLMQPRRRGPGGTHGILEDAQSWVSSLVTGGNPGSADYNNRVSMLGDAGGIALQKFVATPEGQATVNKLAWEVGIAALLIGATAGYLLGRRRKGSA